MEENTYVPFLNCGWKSSEDGCCSHPSNAAPECHQFICPIKAAQQNVERTPVDIGDGVMVDPLILGAILD